MYIFKFNKFLKRSISFRKNVNNKEIILHPYYSNIRKGEKLSFKDIVLDKDLSFIKLDSRGI